MTKKEYNARPEVIRWKRWKCCGIRGLTIPQYRIKRKIELGRWKKFIKKYPLPFKLCEAKGYEIHCGSDYILNIPPSIL